MTKRSYPIHRRSPVSHNVSGHTRDGHSVGGYTRGSGKTRTIPISRGKTNAEAFTVTLKYGDGAFEIIHVFAPKGDYKKALDEALEERSQQHRYPIEVNVKDPSLGEVIGFIRKGVGTGLKYVKKGIKKASPHVKEGARTLRREFGRSVKSVGRQVSSSISSSLQNREAKRLVRHSYSDDPGVSALARVKLKKKYPEVYDNCDFSRRVKPKTEKSKKKKKSITEILLGSKKKKKKS